MFTKFSPYLIALLIGLLIGVDREKRRTKGNQAMGVRSFILFALVGAIAGGVMQPMFSLGMLIFATTLTVFGYMKTSTNGDAAENPLGLTTEIAAMATFGLGYLAQIEPFIALALAAIILFVLNNKTFVHTLIRRHLQPKEIQGASILLLLAFGVVPLIPNHTIDPFNIFNPHRLAVIIVLLAGIEFVGYLATRIFGDRIGLPLTGFFAGIVSSTAAFLVYPALAQKRPASISSIASAALFSIAGTLCLAVVVVGAISWRLILGISIPLASLILISFAIGITLARRGPTLTENAEQANPLNLLTAIKLAVLLTSLIFLVNLTQYYLGATFTNVVTFLAGLFDLHGGIIAGANMLENDAVTIDASASVALIAITASMVSKIAITGFLGRGAYRQLMLPIIFGLAGLSFGFWVLAKYVPVILLRV